MKMTKKQTERLLHILTSLEAAQDYLESKNTQIFYANKLQGIRIPGRWYSERRPDMELEGPIQKFVGSNLALLPDGIKELREFIKEYQYHNHLLVL